MKVKHFSKVRHVRRFIEFVEYSEIGCRLIRLVLNSRCCSVLGN